MRHWQRIAWVSVLVATLGCNSEPFQRAPVKGTVTFSGEAIPKGTITFIPTTTEPSTAASAAIVNGKFDLPKETGPSIGTHRVEILATREGVKKEAGPPHPPGTMVEVTEQYIPAEFNHQSRLTVEIQTGPNEHNFTLP